MKETDTLENFTINGNLSVLPGLNIDDGDGDIECYGIVFSDTINENTTDVGVTIENINIKNNVMTINNVTQPINPSINKLSFYIDNTDNLLKSIDSTSNIKIYNLLTNKGDIQTHNGTIDTILPLGSNGQILTVNNSTNTGLQWVDTINSVNSNAQITVSLNSTNKGIIIEEYIGSYYSAISPLVIDGPCCIFIGSKSVVSNIGCIFRCLNNVSVLNNTELDAVWDIYCPLSIYKNNNYYDGIYLNKNNSNYSSYILTLTGTSWVTYTSLTTGVYFISINNINSGPTCNVFLCKSSSTFNSCAIYIASSSPGTSNCNLQFRWLSGSGLQISKTQNTNDGDYYIIDNFQNITSTTITLTGTNSTIVDQNIFRFYKLKSFIVRVYSTLLDSPKSIGLLSKNNNAVTSPAIYISSPGKTTLEQININWLSNSLLSVNKTNINYDSTYTIDITPLL